MKTTLCITIFNRGTLLNYSLDRLTRLTIPDEIIVVNDGGSDNTEQVCENYKSKLPIKYIYNHNPEWSICSMARNIALKQSEGDLFVTSEPELLWVTDIIPQMLKAKLKYPNNIINVGTIYHMQQGITNLEELTFTNPKEYLAKQIVENYQIEPRPYDQKGYVKTQNMQATFCCMYEKKWLMEIGGWDEGFPGAWGWDDVDLGTRLRENGIGQFNDLSMEAIHQWHSHLLPHLQGEASRVNEEYFKSKNYQVHPELIVSNQGKEWGIVKA